MNNNRYAGLITNDFSNGQGVCVSFWTQGCPHKCKGCHNPETWDFNGGQEIPYNIKEIIIKAISKNNIIRNFSILGGEPLCNENLKLTEEIINEVRKFFPKIKIFIWTGYTLESLKKRKNSYVNNILSSIDVLIDGPFIESEKDLTLKLRGSKNQRILYKNIDF